MDDPGEDSCSSEGEAVVLDVFTVRVAEDSGDVNPETFPQHYSQVIDIPNNLRRAVYDAHGHFSGG